ncbi:hypothetical protein [Bacillus sp. FJAT-47783]|uniref:hypothetical protein n=1 Tax=Bacillus sp. FJAT-47783 TaxID=2922712 RepID=UPI001FAC69F3
MLNKDVMTNRWGNKEIVTSPSYGTIQSIHLGSKARIYEWEPLLSIQTEDGQVLQIRVGVSGIIDSYTVKEGDRVVPGTVIAYIEEDLMASGSD